MITIQTLMTFSEMRELSKMSHRKYEEIEPILQKEFSHLTVNDFYILCETPIFDLSFTDLLFSEMYIRYMKHKEK